jgi:hypothetical protein
VEGTSLILLQFLSETSPQKAKHANSYLWKNEVIEEEFAKMDPSIEQLNNFTQEKKTWALHYLRIHVPQYVKFWFPIFHCGYGVFSMQGPEHTNKIVKSKILQHTQIN